MHENLDQPIETIAAMEAVVALQPDDARASRPARVAVPARRCVGEGGRELRARRAARARRSCARGAARGGQAVSRQRPARSRGRHLSRDRRAPAGDLDAWKRARRAADRARAVARARRRARRRGRSSASGVDKAALLRAQARALEQAGERPRRPRWSRWRRGMRPRMSAASSTTPTCSRARGAAARRRTCWRRGSTRRSIAARRRGQVAALRLRLVGVLDDAGRARAGEPRCSRSCSRRSPSTCRRSSARREREPDPRAQAELWLRLAATDGPHRLRALITAAARQLGELGDHRRGCARARATRASWRPTDDELRRTLDEARTAAAIARAQDELRRRRPRGRRAPAAQRARDAAVRRRGEPRARRCCCARRARRAEHLRGGRRRAAETTSRPSTPRSSCTGSRARSRCAAMSTSRTSCCTRRTGSRAAISPITLALGESCFARKLWREAAIHLGSLAEHPDAPAHAAAVAAGLVSAAKAEIRALRPANAREALPRGGEARSRRARAAWHALAELAMERDDMRARDRVPRARGPGDDASRAIGCASTTRSAIWRRTCSAIVARAERYWREVADDASACSTKLLARAAQARRGSRARRDVRAVRGARRRARRKELLEEATQAYAAAGDRARARASPRR